MTAKIPDERPTLRDLVEAHAERRRASERETMPAPPEVVACPMCASADGSPGDGTIRGSACTLCGATGRCSAVDAEHWSVRNLPAGS